MQISVITVSTNSKEHIRNCLLSLKEKTVDLDYEVIVVDNASTDGTPEMVKAEFPWVKLVENPRNLGFGTANNRGAAIATGEMLCFYNDDTIQTQNTLKTVYDKMTSDQSIGTLGFHLTFPDGSHQDSVRAYPHLSDQVLVLLKLHHFFSGTLTLRRYLCSDMDYAVEQDVDQVMGACMVIPRAVFERVKGFDEQFFVWFEEVDLQKRIHEELGLRIVYSPCAEMIHVKGATFGKALSLTNQKRFNRSLYQYMRKHHGVVAGVVVMLLQPVSIVLAWMVQMVRTHGGSVLRKKNTQL